MKKLTLDEIKKNQLEILLAYDKFCKENNLTYFLCGGTLLGAVRHKGFIPWDDDIDVFMPRPDYEKFLELTSFNPIKENIYTCSPYPCLKKIDYPFIKLLDMTTKVSETGRPKQFMAIWIDVFPVDGISDDINSVKKLVNKLAKLRRWFCSCSQDFSAAKNFLNLLKRLIPTLILRIYGVNKLCRKLDSLCKTNPYKNAKNIAGLVWGYGMKECMSKDELKSSVDVQFEGHTFPAPVGWDTYLRNLYGDYMQLPPEDKRVCHGFDAWKLD